MEQDDILFTELRIDGKLVKDCTLAVECFDGVYRLYWTPNPYGAGFIATAVERSQWRCEDDPWNCPHLRVKALVRVTACADGVRHLEVNRDESEQEGCLFWPNVEGFVQILQKVRELEVQLCKYV